MKRVFQLTLVFLCLFRTVSYGQLTIDECQRKVQENYPLVQQYRLIEKSKDYSLANANKGYVPQLSLSAKMTYQSEVTQIPVKLPNVNIDEPRKDQYQAILQLDQTIWNGGMIRAQKENIRNRTEVDIRQVEVNMYALNDRVNQLFFGILLLDEQLLQNSLLLEQLERTYQQVAAYVTNGTANQADLDAVKVERLNSIQHQSELEASSNAYREMLSTLIGSKVDETNRPVRPEDTTIPPLGEVRRPELALYNAQQSQLDAQKSILQANNLPKLGLFVQGAFGNPGLNMLKNEFKPYYIAGVRLSWNFGNLYTKRNESRLIELNRNSVNVQQDIFLFNTGLQITQTNNEIIKLMKLMKDDDEIIALRTNIRKAAEAKVANGTLTVTEMLREITSEDMARQNKMLHDIQLLMAIYNLKYTTNN